MAIGSGSQWPDILFCPDFALNISSSCVLSVLLTCLESSLGGARQLVAYTMVLCYSAPQYMASEHFPDNTFKIG